MSLQINTKTEFNPVRFRCSDLKRSWRGCFLDKKTLAMRLTSKACPSTRVGVSGMSNVVAKAESVENIPAVSPRERVDVLLIDLEKGLTWELVRRRKLNRSFLLERCESSGTASRESLVIHVSKLQKEAVRNG